MMKLYVLGPDGKTPIAVENTIEWALSLNPESNHLRQIASDEIGDAHVSTIFIGIDYSFGRDRTPRCWETMIFGGINDHYSRRYNNHDEALRGHAHAVRYTKRGLPIP